MTKQHSQIIIFLLGGILVVLLFGRDAALGSMQTLFWIGLVLGIIALIIWAIVALVGYTRREVKAYKEEVRRDREEGRPWLHNFLMWPGVIGNFAVFGVAAYSRYVDESCRALVDDCLKNIPYFWAPIALVLLSIPFTWFERMILHMRNRGVE
jgi:ABC-type tungstate transport system substrate-binding protein